MHMFYKFASKIGLFYYQILLERFRNSTVQQSNIKKILFERFLLISFQTQQKPQYVKYMSVFITKSVINTPVYITSMYKIYPYF